MGSNSTQAVAVGFLLIAFTLLAGGLAGGGIVVWLGGIVLIGVSAFFFMKCKPWEDQKE